MSRAQTFGVGDAGFPAVDVTSSIDIFSILLILLGIGVTLATGFFVLHAVRAQFLKRSHMRGGENATTTMQITIPRFKSEDQARKDENAAGIREQIAIAETLYSAIGGLKPQKGLKAWLFGRSDALALEIVAHQKLVTFYITIPKFLREFVEQQIHAQWSSAHIEEVQDYNMFAPTGTVLGGYVRLKRASVFPIKTYKELDADPLNALTNAISRVAETDGVAIQYVVRPAHHNWRSLGLKIAKHMHEGMTLEEAMHGKQSSWLSSKEDREKSAEKRRERKMSQAEQKMIEGIENKVSKAGMDVNIRVIASSVSADVAQSYLNNVLQAFGQYNIYEYGNSFEKSIPRSKKKIARDFIYRSFSDKHRIVLNTEEMAGMFHLPLPTTDTPNIRWMLARTAPAPSEIPTEGLFLGTNMYRGRETKIFIQEADRRRHMYMIGKTGAGKSEYLANLIAQDIAAGKGVGVIDPHGDLADTVLGLIPKERYDDVVYFNPSDTEYPMGLNMLESPNEQMRDFVVQEMISVFYMLFPPEMIGPMFEHSMRNFMLTLMADVNNPGTIVEIPRMISDEQFQKEWVARVKDPIVRSFWEDEQAKTSDYHKSEMMGYLVSKVGRFVENEMMRNIIGQTRSSFNFREIMDEGKILLVNLSKGKTGDVNASLLGLIMVAKLQMAAFSRADTAEKDRKDFYLYIDEFQNFVTPSIATILSEARKYKLNLIMAHQYMGQLVKDGKSEIRDAVLGNVGSYFVARVGPEDTEVLAKVFEPVFSAYDLMNTSNFSWNVKLIVNNAQIKPFSMQAPPLRKPNKKVADALKEVSRLMYGKDKLTVEEEIAERAGLNKSRPATPEPVPQAR